MNDKNFIEELRQKREEYGVTQRKLAVACGISRTYFNQIENGEYSCAATPQIRQTGNRLSGLAETAYASLLAQCFV